MIPGFHSDTLFLERRSKPNFFFLVLNAFPLSVNSVRSSKLPFNSRTPLRLLCDDGAGGGALVLPGRRQDTDGLVVASQTVDTRLDQNQAELGVLVLAVALEVLSDGHGLWNNISIYKKDSS